MKIMSPCCKRPLDIAHKRNEFNGLDIVDVCSECGGEVDYIFTGCESCGEVTEEHELVQTALGDWCQACCELYKSDLQEAKGA